MTAMARVRVRIGWASTGMMDEAVMASVQVTFLQAQHGQRAAGDEMRVVGGDQHGRAETIELLEKMEEAGGKGGINIARGLIGEKEFGLCHNGTGNGNTLLLAAGKNRGEHIRLALEPHPIEKLLHIGAIGLRPDTGGAQGQGDI